MGADENVATIRKIIDAINRRALRQLGVID
jgi:hypothetical protein